MPQTQARSAMFALFVVLFIDGLGQAIFFPILVKALLDPNAATLVAHASMASRNLIYALVIGLYFLTWFLGAGVLGELSDRSGRKNALLVCMGGAATGYLLSALAFIFHSVALLFIGRIIAGFTAGSQSIAQAAITDVSPPEKLTRNVGFILMAVTIGMVMGPILGGVLSNENLVSWFSVSVPLYVATALAVLNFILLAVSFKETSAKSERIRINLGKAISVFVSAFKHDTVRYLSITFLALQLGFSGYFLYISVYLLHHFHMTANGVTVYMVLLGIGFSIGFSFITRMLEPHKAKAKVIIICSYGVLAVGVLITWLASNILWIWLVTIPMAAALSTGYSFMIAAFSAQVDQDRQGWVMGISVSIMALAGGVIVIVAGLLSSISIALPLMVSVGLLALGIVLISCFTRRLAVD
tara:strand:+ start:7750 stop:8988 length:1239 start_codon:yes stop_codon:yes gene_type:complete